MTLLTHLLNTRKAEAMKNKISLTFLTEQTVDGDTQKTKQTATGTMEKQPTGEIRIEYTEPDVEMRGSASELFIENSRKVHLIRTGLYNTHFTMEEGQSYHSLYRSPFGNMDMEIRTSKTEVNIKQDRGTVFLVYSLYSGGSVLSENKLLINIKIQN